MSNIPADWHERLYEHYAECHALCEFPIEGAECKASHSHHECTCDAIVVARADAEADAWLDWQEWER